jgi:hypothetical protein
MKIILKETGEVLAEVVTNRSMTIYEACELAGIDIEPDENGECEYDAERDLVMEY